MGTIIVICRNVSQIAIIDFSSQFSDDKLHEKSLRSVKNPLKHFDENGVDTYMSST